MFAPLLASLHFLHLYVYGSEDIYFDGLCFWVTATSISSVHIFRSILLLLTILNAYCLFNKLHHNLFDIAPLLSYIVAYSLDFTLIQSSSAFCVKWSKYTTNTSSHFLVLKIFSMFFHFVYNIILTLLSKHRSLCTISVVTS